MSRLRRFMLTVIVSAQHISKHLHSGYEPQTHRYVPLQQATAVDTCSCLCQVELAQLLDESDDDAILEHVLPKKNRAPDSIKRLVRAPHGSSRRS